jgi:hypothetical protein
VSDPCPVYPRKRTFVGAVMGSTSAGWAIALKRHTSAIRLGGDILRNSVGKTNDSAAYGGALCHPRKSERATGCTQLIAPRVELALSEECWHRFPRNCAITVLWERSRKWRICADGMLAPSRPKLSRGPYWLRAAWWIAANFAKAGVTLLGTSLVRLRHRCCRRRFLGVIEMS